MGIREPTPVVVTYLLRLNIQAACERTVGHEGISLSGNPRGVPTATHTETERPILGATWLGSICGPTGNPDG